MRIAYLSSSTVPSRAANSVHVMKMCAALAEHGHRVTLVVTDRDRIQEKMQDVFEYYGVESQFEITVVPWRDFRGYAHAYGFRSAHVAKKTAPDLVYGRNLTGCAIAALRGMNTIFESHQPVIEKGSLIEAQFRLMIRSRAFKRLVVITHALRDYYLRRYPLLNGRIQVAPDGADCIVPASGEPEADNTFDVGYIGHLYSGKSMEILSELAPRCPESRFHIVGGTDSDIEYWKKRLASENTMFHGFVPHRQVPSLLQTFGIVLAPFQRQVSTHGDASGNDIGRWFSPLKVFEYMAAGKAIVCSDLPVLHEVLSHDSNAMLCPPDDIDTWVSTIKELQSDPDKRRRLGRQAQKDFTRNYTWTARAARVLEGVGE